MWGFTVIVLAGVLVDSLLQQLFLGILSIDDMFWKSFGILWGFNGWAEGVLLKSIGLALSPQTISKLSGKQACGSIYIYLSVVMFLKLIRVLMWNLGSI